MSGADADLGHALDSVRRPGQLLDICFRERSRPERHWGGQSCYVRSVATCQRDTQGRFTDGVCLFWMTKREVAAMRRRSLDPLARPLPCEEVCRLRPAEWLALEGSVFRNGLACVTLARPGGSFDLDARNYGFLSRRYPLAGWFTCEVRPEMLVLAKEGNAVAYLMPRSPR